MVLGANAPCTIPYLSSMGIDFLHGMRIEIIIEYDSTINYKGICVYIVPFLSRIKVKIDVYYIKALNINKID